MSESSLDRNPVERIAAEFAERVRGGEHPSLTEYIERYPELADDIRELFPMLAMVEQFKPATIDGDPQAASPGAPTGGDHPQQLGDYRILRYLGEGGMGVVYEAVRKALHSHVALKVMHRQFRGRKKYLHRFMTEARSAARLHHTNIVSVFDYGVHDGVCFYAMQHIPGQSLDKILDDVRQLRRESDQPAPAATEPSTPARSNRDWSAIARRVFGADGAGANSVRQTVTLGILTGTYELDARTAETGPSEDATPAFTRSLAGHEAANAAAPPSQLADPLVGRIGNPSYGSTRGDHHAEHDDYATGDSSTST